MTEEEIMQRLAAARTKRRRAPVTGLTMAELCRITRVSPRTIAAYVRRGLLTAPQFRASATRYNRDHLLRVVAVQVLKGDGVKRLREVHDKLQSMGSQELDAWLRTKQLRDEVAQALGFARSPVTPVGSTELQPALPAQQLSGQSSSAYPVIHQAPPQAESWQRVRLLPGLELTWQADAAPFAQHLADYFRAYLQRITQTQ